MSADPCAALLAYAARHYGLFNRTISRRCGVADSTVQSWLRTGRIERVAPEVFRVAGTPLSWHGDVMAATLHVNGWASHGTAIAQHELEGARRLRPVHVVTLRWHRRHPMRGVVVHETLDLRGVDLTVVRGIPTTSLVRTLVDASAVVHPFLAGMALDSACRTNASLFPAVTKRFLELARRGRPGTVATRLLLAQRTPGGGFDGSGFEAKMARIIASRRLPKPVNQHRIEDGDFLAVIDKAWPNVKLGIECDSLAHHFGARPHQWERTRRRRLHRLGWELAEYTYEDVTEREQMVGDEIEEAYYRRLAEHA
jgi:hypothetical protein